MATIKQKHFQRTEALLFKYNMIKLGIGNMKDELRELSMRDGLGSIDPGAEVFKTNKISSVTESSAIDNLESAKVKSLKIKIAASEDLISGIDKILSELKEAEQDIIHLYYMQGKKEGEISKIVNYTREWCGQLRRKAVNTISIGLGYSIAEECKIHKIS